MVAAHARDLLPLTSPGRREQRHPPCPGRRPSAATTSGYSGPSLVRGGFDQYGFVPQRAYGFAARDAGQYPGRVAASTHPLPPRRGQTFSIPPSILVAALRTRGSDGVKLRQDRTSGTTRSRFPRAGGSALVAARARARAGRVGRVQAALHRHGAAKRDGELQPGRDERRRRGARLLLAADYVDEAADEGRRHRRDGHGQRDRVPTCALTCRSTARSASRRPRPRSRPGDDTVGDAATACAGCEHSRRPLESRADRLQPGDPARDRRAARRHGPEAGCVALFICPPPADLPAGTTGRTARAKIVRLTLRLTNAFTVPPGTHLWHLLATPYLPGSAVANPAAAVEAEAEHGLPQQLTLAAKPPGVEPLAGLRPAHDGRQRRLRRTVRDPRQREAGREGATNAAGASRRRSLMGSSHATLTAKVFVPARYRSRAPIPPLRRSRARPRSSPRSARPSARVGIWPEAAPRAGGRRLSAAAALPSRPRTPSPFSARPARQRPQLDRLGAAANRHLVDVDEVVDRVE